ncbi:hypothetical protein [Epibacterium ulvae]|uniref:hypothetical protein n=1 Tax=Epibacterium ulvae TaxID=1156985 RepID=UPI002493C6C9|nr:hypothetical protein [Epibacterium ulvae]
MTVPHIQPLTTTPDPISGRATFDNDMATRFAEQNSWTEQANAQADFVNEKAQEAGQSQDLAAQSASAANGSAQQAAASAAAAALSAEPWVPDSDYSIGDTAWSPVTLKTYRAKTGHSGLSTDPSTDTDNWALVGADPRQAARSLLFSLWLGA